MAKVKVRVLYPTAFVTLGVKADAEEVSIEEDDAAALVAQGYAEYISKARRTETADVKLKADA